MVEGPAVDKLDRGQMVIMRGATCWSFEERGQVLISWRRVSCWAIIKESAVDYFKRGQLFVSWRGEHF